MAVEDLPSALEDVNPSPFCEPCERNGKLKMTAGTYCVNCERKLCAAHQKVCMTDPNYLYMYIIRTARPISLFAQFDDGFCRQKIFECFLLNQFNYFDL